MPNIKIEGKVEIKTDRKSLVAKAEELGMESKYGIIFGGYLLSEDAFIKIFKDFYEQRGKEFMERLREDVIKAATTFDIHKKGGGTTQTRALDPKKYSAKEIYERWEKITKDFFGNGETTILAGVDFNGEGWQWTQIIDEKQVITESGISIIPSTLKQKSEEMSGIMAGAALDAIINQHYENMERSLIKYLLSKDPEAIYLHILLWYRKSKLRFISGTKKARHFTRENYENIFFASQENDAGKKLDAFMNHVGQYHAELFSILSNKNISTNTISNLDLKFFDDDFMTYFSSKPIEAQKWLLDSLNSTSWLAGGDIVVTDNIGRVLYSIQLKTTAQKSGKIFGVASARLVAFADRLEKLFAKNDVDKIAKYMFKILKTEAANGLVLEENKLNTKILEEIYNNLKLS